jgi:CRP-like cAMP-binding protein
MPTNLEDHIASSARRDPEYALAFALLQLAAAINANNAVAGERATMRPGGRLRPAKPAKAAKRGRPRLGDGTVAAAIMNVIGAAGRTGIVRTDILSGVAAVCQSSPATVTTTMSRLRAQGLLRNRGGLWSAA